MHRILMLGARRSAGAGEFRTGQNFVGPDNDIGHAVYVPVPAGKIAAYLANLEEYVSAAERPFCRQQQNGELWVLDAHTLPLFKIAVMHAQFESIHPFWDGNGRIGRILIPLLSLKYGLTAEPLLLPSYYLERMRTAYYRALNAVRGDKPQWAEWLYFFMGCVQHSAARLAEQAGCVSQVYAAGLDSCRRESERRVWTAAFTKPLISCSQAAATSGLSPAAARNALQALAERKLLSAENQGVRPRTYLNHQLYKILHGCAAEGNI